MRTRILLAGAAAVAVAAATMPSAHAIVGGQPDGEGHPNVAMLLFYAEEAPGEPAFRYRCSGSLATPTVILTAAHCVDGVIGKVLVTFRSDIAQQPPSGLPRAADDPLDPVTLESPGSSIGFTADQAPGNFDFVSGDGHVHPEYSDFTDFANWNDVGVVTLDTAVTSAAPVEVAPLGSLDVLTQNLLNKTLFTFVGYGVNVGKPDTGPKRPTLLSYPLNRRVATEQGRKLFPQVLETLGNPNDAKGDGGTCFGDSGGPGFLDGKQVTVTSYGRSDICRFMGGYQRLDIPVVQEWLATFGIPGMSSDSEAASTSKGKGQANGNGNGNAGGNGNGNAGGNGNGNAGGNGNGNAGGNGTSNAGGNGGTSNAGGNGNGKAVGQSNAHGRDAVHALTAG